VFVAAVREYRWWVLATLVLLAVLAFLPFLVMPFYVRVGQLVLLSAGLALAWTLLGGFAGYWSFGHTAFIGLGAFAAGLFETELMRGAPLLGFAAGLLVGAALCAGVAAVVAWPILRLRGIYFAIAMLGVSQVLAELNNNIDLFKGALGLVLPRSAAFGLRPEAVFYYLLLVATSLILLIAFAVKTSRIGYGLVALREDEDTARMLGVPTERFKIAMFVLSAALTGALGVIYAHSLGYITTDSVYRTDFSLNMIVYNLLGGIGTLVGPLLGSLVMVVLTQVVLGRLLSIHMFITGAILVLLVLLAPKGLIGLFRRRAEGAE
jgi:branched-chain amino acid transport system permease protein